MPRYNIKFVCEDIHDGVITTIGARASNRDYALLIAIRFLKSKNLLHLLRPHDDHRLLRPHDDHRGSMSRMILDENLEPGGKTLTNRGAAIAEDDRIENLPKKSRKKAS